MDHKEQLVKAGAKMKADKLTVETWGNLSICDRERGLVTITPSGMDYDAIAPEDMVVVDLAGNHVEGFRKPSIEVPMHTAIYRARPDVSAIIHTHPSWSTVFSCMGEDIPVFHDEGAQALNCEVVRTAKYALPSTPELAKNCLEALGEASACMLMSHGAVCVGDSIAACFKVSAVLEMMAQLYQLIRATGGQPVPLSRENIAIMRDFARTQYGQR